MKDEHQLFAEWSSLEQKRLGPENLFKKCLPEEMYNGKQIR